MMKYRKFEQFIKAVGHGMTEQFKHDEADATFILLAINYDEGKEEIHYCSNTKMPEVIQILDDFLKNRRKEMN